jgi:calcium-dependent protein kinase
MLLALHYLHCQGMVHRDVKLENFLYDCQGGSHLKMIDFGFSKFYDAKGRMKTSCGTLAYVAPEVLKKSYTSQCDLWSMGVIVFILLSGRMPFCGESEEQIQHIKKGRYSFKPEHWSSISKTGQDFTKALLELDPTKRSTSKAALEHPWLKQSFQAAAPWCDSSIICALRSWTLAPKLHRACMSMMAWSLTNKHHTEVRDHFLALDTNHNGTISLHELKEVLRRSDCDIQGEVHQVCELLSQTQDAEIRYSDFLAAMLCSHLELDEDVLKVTFKKFDRRGSGSIASQDLKSILGASFEGEAVETLIQDGDLNGDGKLDYQEFARYIRSSRATLIEKSQSTSNLNASEGVPLRPPVLLGRQGSRFSGNAVDKTSLPYTANIAQQKALPFVANTSAQTAEVIERPASKQPQACCSIQ